MDNIWDLAKGLVSKDVGDQEDRKLEHISSGEQLDTNKTKKVKGHHPAPAPPHGSGVIFRDVVVVLSTSPHRKKEGVTTVPQLEAFVHSRVTSKEYANKKNRDLTVVGAFVDQPGTSLIGLGNRVLKIRLGTGQRFGHVMLYGVSLGGRQVIDLAATLAATASATVSVSVTYVGVADGAFFEADTANQPNGPNSSNRFRPTNTPLMKGFSPPVTAATRNVFQTKGNLGIRSMRGPVWTSTMFGGEIHGRIPGFQDFDVTTFCVQEDHTALHSEAAHMGENMIFADMKFLLNQVK